MKRLNYIFILLSFFVVSCTTDDIITDVNNEQYPSGQIQLAARFLPFNEYDVKSRATDDITFDFVIFGSDSKCVYYNHSVNEVVSIDRSLDFRGIDQNVLAECYVYVLANYSAIYEKITRNAGSSVESTVRQYIEDNIIGKVGTEYFTEIVQPVAANVNLSENALPRFGAYTEGLNFQKDHPVESGTMYTINMQSLYAKMVFNIEVDPTENNPDIIDANTFQLTGYTVNNLAGTVDLLGGTEGSTHDQISVHTKPIIGESSSIEGNNLTFTCYIPERFFRPGDELSADNFVYPFGSGDDIREEDKERRQRYKPLLAKGHESYNSEYDETKDRKATYITVSGVFKNHQGHSYDVSYDVYVGNDHFGNFDIVRNRQYNNFLTIKGINNSSDQSSSGNSVAIDHRVNISRTLPVIINLRRETLLDAHFEVRPLRIRKNTNHTAEPGEVVPTHALVKVIYEEGEETPKNTDDDGTNSNNWIGLERSMGVGTSAEGQDLYCTSSDASNGKRKYFTYGLTTGIKYDGSKENYNLCKSSTDGVVVPIDDDGECVWIYVDECIKASTSIDAKRKATIQILLGNYNESAKDFSAIGDEINYVINQHKLLKLTMDNRTYYIEHEEEYLHNFDSESGFSDEFRTDEEGMSYGLPNVQLSHSKDALYMTYQPTGLGSWLLDLLLGLFNAGSIEEFCNNAIKKTMDPKYDFYLTRDNVSGIDPRDYQGLEFNREISAYLISEHRNEGNAQINGVQLSETPKSAFSYCYNRNKRNADGTICSLDWYLPAIDQMEDIMKSGHNYFTDFHGKYYWSCQPSYYKHNFEISYDGSTFKGTYYTENTSRARSTKAEIDEETGQFKAVESSASDLYGTQFGSISKSWGLPNEYSPSNYVNNNNFDPDHNSHPGNKERGVKCRVRAVRATAIED